MRSCPRSAAPTASSALLGQVVSHYRVVGVLGGGGMGVVYKGEDIKLSRPVALKFLTEELSRRPSLLQRLEHEARTASSLNHPNICTIYDFGEHQRQPFIVMEFLEGETLRELIANLAQAELCGERDAVARPTPGDRDPDRRRLGSGPCARHHPPGHQARECFCHPERNRQAPRFRLGVAIECRCAMKTAATESRQPPAAGRRMFTSGTPDYMSPEQVRGEPLDQRSDLFSFGIVLAELFCGAHPFRRESGPTTRQMPSCRMGPGWAAIFPRPCWCSSGGFFLERSTFATKPSPRFGQTWSGLPRRSPGRRGPAPLPKSR